MASSPPWGNSALGVQDASPYAGGGHALQGNLDRVHRLPGSQALHPERGIDVVGLRPIVWRLHQDPVPAPLEVLEPRFSLIIGDRARPDGSVVNGDLPVPQGITGGVDVPADIVSYAGKPRVCCKKPTVRRKLRPPRTRRIRAR